MLVWAMQPVAIGCERAMQVKRNAASRLGQAIGQLARVSIHMSESEGHHAPRRHGRRHRKERRTEDAASGDDVSSQASASSATQQRLKACFWGILCRLTFKKFKVLLRPGRGGVFVYAAAGQPSHGVWCTSRCLHTASATMLASGEPGQAQDVCKFHGIQAIRLTGRGITEVSAMAGTPQFNP